MTTKREQVLTALFAKIQAACVSLGWADVYRNHVVPVEVPSGGLLILRDGAPGEPEVTLSPLTYSWRHRAEVEIYAQSTSGDHIAIFDRIAAALGVALASDRTLGGLCDWVEPMPPEPQTLPIAGGSPIMAASIPVTLYYDTTDPLI